MPGMIKKSLCAQNGQRAAKKLKEIYLITGPALL